MNHYTNFLLNLVFTSITFYGTQKGFLRLTMFYRRLLVWFVERASALQSQLVLGAPSGQQEAADIGEKPVARER